jgi:hypothetical protein
MISSLDIIYDERCPVATFHRPHPSRITGKASLEDVRRFLENAGVEP